MLQWDLRDDAEGMLLIWIDFEKPLLVSSVAISSDSYYFLVGLVGIVKRIGVRIGVQITLVLILGWAWLDEVEN